MAGVEVNILHGRSGAHLKTLNNLQVSSTIADVKKEYHKNFRKYYPERQSLKLDQAGRSLKDDQTLQGLGIKTSCQLYFKDLGPQVSWTTVFLTEYSGPIALYLLFYVRPTFIYGAAASAPRPTVVHIAAACFTFHYAKRILETLFVHRFSNATMPIMNIFKNSGYYWSFAAFISYFVNHPLYTPPAFGNIQIYSGLAGFIFGELGNFSIHLALKNLRPPGTKLRRIPRPTSNPFTFLFFIVSCPNYTYETLIWCNYSIMTQCLPAGMFMSVGFVQMAIWALGKHRNYKREFKDYPRARKAILPFIL